MGACPPKWVLFQLTVMNIGVLCACPTELALFQLKLGSSFICCQGTSKGCSKQWSVVVYGCTSDLMLNNIMINKIGLTVNLMGSSVNS
jgi:hypothetical protein